MVGQRYQTPDKPAHLRRFRGQPGVPCRYGGMLKMTDVRAQPAVRDFDFTEKLAEYGFTTGTRADLDKARALVTDAVSDADRVITERQQNLIGLGENQYKRRVYFNGEEVKFASAFSVFESEGEVTARIESQFPKTSEVPVPNRPDVAVVARRIREALAQLVERDGYEVVGIEEHNDGTPKRVICRDPEWAAMAEEREGKPDVVDLSAVTRALHEEDAKKLDASAEQMGLHQGVTADQIAIVRSVAKELIELGVRDILERIQALKDSGVSAYNTAPFTFSDYVRPEFLDKRLATGIFSKSIARPVVIESFNAEAVNTALTKRFKNYGEVLEGGTFHLHVRKLFVERLRAEPGLPLAAVACNYGYSNWKLSVVLVSPQALLQADRTPLQRLFGVRKAEVPALPAPAPAEIPKVGPVTPPQSVLAGTGTTA